MNSVIFCLLISFSICQKWENMDMLFSSDQIAWNPTILQDNENERLHATFTALSENEFPHLVYTYMGYNGKPGDEYYLFGRYHSFFYPKQDVVLINNDTTLFGAFTVINRDQNVSIVYSESPVQDVNWTAPQQIGHGGYHTRRFAPTVLYCKETERIWIFYYRYDHEHLSICYVTRPKGSVIFTHEHTVLSGIHPSSFIQLGYTLDSQEQPILHMFFTMHNDTSDDLIYMHSKDNGLRWNFATIADVMVEQEFEPIRLLIYPEKNMLIISNVDHGDDEKPYLRLTISQDSGSTWKTYEYLIRDDDQTPHKIGAMVAGKWKNNDGIFVYMAFYDTLHSSKNKIETADQYTKGTMKFIRFNALSYDTELEPPFRDINPEIAVFPYLAKKDNTLYAVASLCKGYPFSWCELYAEKAEIE